ncbi:MAG: hypothetical protein M3R09_12095 [Actinomycetota bacterium]|nr:hypothetical protein [Actinomycetota bacterium]
MWVDVFDLGCCGSQDDLRRFFPLVERPVTTPVIGVWSDGTHLATAAGWPGIRLIEQYLRMKVSL